MDCRHRCRRCTGRHTHLTPRFVYVLEGSVNNGKPPQTFKSGEAFAELPGVVHNFRNGFQVAPKGAPLQTTFNNRCLSRETAAYRWPSLRAAFQVIFQP